MLRALAAALVAREPCSHCSSAHTNTNLPCAARPHPQKPALKSFRWPGRLRRQLPWLSEAAPPLSLGLRTSTIRQALYVAYARHDAVSDYFTACLRFLERGDGAEPLAELAKRYGVPGGRLADLVAFPEEGAGEVKEKGTREDEGERQAAGDEEERQAEGRQRR